MSNRIKWVDYLKGISCILVFVSHFLYAFYPASFNGDSSVSHVFFDTYLGKEPFAIISDGKFYVYIFLILSGFLMSNKLLNSNIDNSKTLIKRYLSIVFPIFAVCLLTLIVYKLDLMSNVECSRITNSFWLEAQFASELTVWNLLTNSFFLIPFLGNSMYSTVFWMLNYIIFGALLTVILCFTFNKKSKNILFVAIPMIWCVINSSSYLCFVLSFLIIYIDKFYDIKIFNNKTFLIALMLVGIYFGMIPANTEPSDQLMLLIYNSPIRYYIEITKFIHEIGAFLVVLSLFNIFKNNSIRKEHKILSFLGRISFSIYLLHILIICSFSSTLFMQIYSLLNSYNLVVLIVFISSLVLLLVISWLFNKYIEKNCKKLINRLIED